MLFSIFLSQGLLLRRKRGLSVKTSPIYHLNVQLYLRRHERAVIQPTFLPFHAATKYQRTTKRHSTDRNDRSNSSNRLQKKLKKKIPPLQRYLNINRSHTASSRKMISKHHNDAPYRTSRPVPSRSIPSRTVPQRSLAYRTGPYRIPYQTVPRDEGRNMSMAKAKRKKNTIKSLGACCISRPRQKRPSWRLRR